MNSASENVTAAGTADAVPVTTYIIESDANLSGLATAAGANLLTGPGANLLNEYQVNGGLFFNNVSSNRIDEIAATNSALLGATVDALGKINTPGAFESYNSSVTNAAALTVSNCSSGCTSFDGAFDVSETDLATGWEIVKIGVKYGNKLAYFLVDGDGDGNAEANDGFEPVIVDGDVVLIEKITGRVLDVIAGAVTPEPKPGSKPPRR